MFDILQQQSNNELDVLCDRAFNAVVVALLYRIMNIQQIPQIETKLIPCHHQTMGKGVNRTAGVCEYVQ